MGAFCIGTMLGWISPMQPLLESPTPPVGDSALSREQVSWLGSINFIGAIVGTFFWGRLSDWVGRRNTAIIVAIPFAVGWLILLFALDITWLYIGRLTIGLGCSGVIINGPMFVTEIAQDSIRGTLGSFLMLSVNIGCLFCYIVGAYTTYTILTSICLAIPVIYFFLLMLMPESPAFLIAKNKKSKAEKALRWYRGGDPVQTEKEINALQEKRSKKRPGYRALFESKGRIKAMLIGFGFIFGQQFCGILAILTYAVTIFTESGSSLSPYSSAIIVGSLQCVSSLLSSVLVDKAGRRCLLMMSYTSMAISLIVLGIYNLFKESLGPSHAWIPILSLSTHVISYSLGAGPVPFIVMAETFSPDVRGVAMSVIQLLGTSLSFASVKLFPFLNSALGQHGCFLFFGICCIGQSCFTLFCVPETKGKTLQAILRRLNGETDDETQVEMVTKNNVMIVKNLSEK
ncbi:hypothetical protein O3M35_012833 [Rhynocoris fuscipes]|uniref:Major facilitator superfamily (MFS) profile domain-containing protein n=1 Tax=Rhynocoris fuscipes TaxID=488301 RepID=A0AAW1CL73_9HEMI